MGIQRSEGLGSRLTVHHMKPALTYRVRVRDGRGPTEEDLQGLVAEIENELNMLG